MIYTTKLRIRQPAILRNLAEYEKTQWYSLQQIEDYQRSRLEKLLYHAFQHVPYYKKVMQENGIVKNGNIDPDRFANIPFLTKKIIREHFDEIKSDDLETRKWYINSSGGSTGEPVRFIQDRHYAESNLPKAMLGSRIAGKDLCETEVALWGSTRDLFREKESLKARIDSFIRNQRILNSFKMSPDDMRRYIKQLNKMRPKLLVAYAQSAYELAHFSLEQSLPVEGVSSVMTSPSTLYPFMREEISKAFRAPVFNRYGSREVGSIATECEAHTGLHISMETQLVEIVDSQGNYCKPGEEGEIIVTSLTNYAMPLIRYRIGDVGIWSDQQCPCGRGARMLESVTGRVTDYFISRDGKVVPSEYFIHLLGVVLNSGWVRKTQIIQEDYDYINVRFVASRQPDDEELANIKDKIQLVMGQNCKVEFEFVDDIPSSSSGKYRYTISKVHDTLSLLPLQSKSEVQQGDS